MFFVILVDDDYCVAIHDLSPVLTALFSIELGGFNNVYFYIIAECIFPHVYGYAIVTICNIDFNNNIYNRQGIKTFSRGVALFFSFM